MQLQHDVEAGVVRTALDLIAARSISGDEALAAAVFADALREFGAKVDVDGYGNVTGTWDFGPGPVVLFETHLDTVPVADADRWTRNPAGELADGIMFGRGAVDMKGPIAACLHGVASIRDSHREGRVVISGSVAEELVEGAAILGVLDTVRPDVVVICEPSQAKIAVGQRGRAEVVIEASGASAHSAYPQAGSNAADAIADLAAALRTLEFPTHPRLGHGLLVLTGLASEPFPSLSVVPDRCVATFDRRTLPGETLADVLDPIRVIAARVTAETGVRFDVQVAVDDVLTYGGERLVAPNFAPAWTTASDGSVVDSVIRGLRAAGVTTEVSTTRSAPTAPAQPVPAVSRQSVSGPGGRTWRTPATNGFRYRPSSRACGAMRPSLGP
jgi:putative selenium metabolism hydrolase